MRGTYYLWGWNWLNTHLFFFYSYSSLTFPFPLLPCSPTLNPEILDIFITSTSCKILSPMPNNRGSTKLCAYIDHHHTFFNIPLTRTSYSQTRKYFHNFASKFQDYYAQLFLFSPYTQLCSAATHLKICKNYVHPVTSNLFPQITGYFVSQQLFRKICQIISTVYQLNLPTKSMWKESL